MSNVAKQIEVSIEDLKKKVAKNELLKRLEKNRDFKRFILEDYCEVHALGLIRKKVSPAYQDDMNQAYIKDQLTAVGSLQLYMQFTRQEAKIAAEAIQTAEEELELAREEEV